MEKEKLEKLYIRVQTLAPTVKKTRMKLRAWLDEMGLEMGEFCALVNISRSYIYQISSSLRSPSKELMNAIKELTLNRVRTISDLREDE